MDYVLSFLEGMITFVSPCLLPMLPVYALYFAGGGTAGRANAYGGGPAGPGENAGDGEKSQATPAVLLNALAFVLGFTAVFLCLGAFAGVLGRLLVRWQRPVQIGGGLIVILFGAQYLGLLGSRGLGFQFFAAGSTGAGKPRITGFFSAFLFGLVFSLTWTPCVGAFLGSALVLAAQKSSALQGILMLLCYSLGLGIPFMLGALLIHQGKTGFSFIKKRLNLISKFSGAFLILTGLLLASGWLGALLQKLSFL